ncbi:hypothetical protein [Bradyrhizobium stylosanthis]|uniref:hypothetical protein n=1 Tax=Bradyrhizobium stylosanthis TaxID=1803665 RepID=UPI0007C5C64A|nr:hypothetical protein [Bradyrhizobium stylosanthis]
MPFISHYDDELADQATAALNTLEKVLKGREVRRYLGSIVVVPLVNANRKSKLQRRPDAERREMDAVYGTLRNRSITKKEREEGLVFAERAAAEVGKKSVEFKLPAFQALQEFKDCLSDKDYLGALCLVAFLVTLASIVMPLANPRGKEK